MKSAIVLVIIGVLVWFVVPMFAGNGKKSGKRSIGKVCKIVGILIIFLGIYRFVETILSL